MTDQRILPGVREVARLAGVSRGTVSNVINYPERVRPETRERVEDAIRELGFVPDSNARSLTTGNNDIVGLVVPGLLSSFFIELAHGAQEGAQDRDLNLLIAVSVADQDGGGTRQPRHLQYFDSTRSRGILFAPASSADAEIERIHGRGGAIVLINYETALDVPAVLVDEREAGRIAVRTLRDAGVREAVWVGGLYGYQPATLRRQGAREAAGEVGVALQERDAGGLSAANGWDLADELVAADPPIDAIVTASGSLAVGIYRRYVDAGVVPPRIIACEGNSVEIGVDAPIAAVEQPGKPLGTAAMELVVAPVNAAERVTKVFTPQLVVRDSLRR